jgi:hypothetical protein
MSRCEMCQYRSGYWYLFDNNAEVKLCGGCASLLRYEGESVERIEGTD